MTGLPPPSMPQGNLVVATLAGFIVSIIVAYGFSRWVWQLGDFGSWGEHWPYFKDALEAYFRVRGSGDAWWVYYQHMDAGGHLTGLYARLSGLLIVSLAAGFSAGAKVYANSRATDIHVRGLDYIKDPKLALKLARKNAAEERLHDSSEGVHVHPDIRISGGRENLGFLAVGAQGSGKTQFLRPIIDQAIRQNHRALIFDYKGEYTETLPVADDELVLIAPWDARSARWAVAEDIRNRSDARLVAQILIQDSDDPMWSNASRQVLTGLIHYLCLTRPRQWGFPDLVALLHVDADTLARVLPIGNPEAQRIVENLMADGKTAQSVLINTQAFLSPISDVAEAWAGPAEGFSIRRWLADDFQGPRILVVQGSSVYEPLVKGLLSAFLTVLISRVVDPSFPEARQRKADYRLFFFLDEFPRLGKIADVEKLIAVGRSKGARLLLGFQDIAQVRAIYGHEAAAAWFSQLATQFYGRVPPGETANWVSSILGHKEVDHPNRSISAAAGRDGQSETLGWQPTEKRLILPGQLATDLKADPRGVTGLLQCTGWPHIYRLHWPITALKPVRPASVQAAWTRPSEHSAETTGPVSGASADTLDERRASDEQATQIWRRRSPREDSAARRAQAAREPGVSSEIEAGTPAQAKPLEDASGSPLPSRVANRETGDGPDPEGQRHDRESPQL